ncbi:MAG TPA: phosphotransferase [Gaiellaceae bacterium]|nr:phosphotransferase [Gaiellaceae bacterium]
MEAETIVERLWPGAGASVEPLGGGITNHNFKVRIGGETFVVRIGGRDTELLGIDREHERAASELAAALGVGPEVVAFLDGCLVTRFIDGRPAENPQPSEVAETLRLVHGARPIPGRFDAFRVVETYRRTAEERGTPVPAAYGEAARRAAAIEPRRRGQALRPCHNDLLSANFIDDGTRLRIVDWEYAGMGDPYFDLGNFAANHDLDEGAERALLEAYAGSAEDEALDALRDMRFMSDFREAMWGVVQQAISDVDFDFAAYADRHFERALA